MFPCYKKLVLILRYVSHFKSNSIAEGTGKGFSVRRILLFLEKNILIFSWFTNIFLKSKTYLSLLFPLLKYCILIGCSLHTKSDIMQDDVNWPITLSCVAAIFWKQSFFSKLYNFCPTRRKSLKKLNKIYSLPVLPVTKQQKQSQFPVCFSFPTTSQIRRASFL